MARNAAYSHIAAQMELPDLLTQAELVEAITVHPAWKLVQASIDAHRERLLTQLLNPTAKPQDVDRLRGEIRGLQAMGEAAETIVSLAADREAEANAAVKAQETNNV